jgi:hypothetical protein
MRNQESHGQSTGKSIWAGVWSESKPDLLNKLNCPAWNPAKLTNSLTHLRKDCGQVSQLKPTAHKSLLATMLKNRRLLVEREDIG